MRHVCHPEEKGWRPGFETICLIFTRSSPSFETICLTRPSLLHHARSLTLDLLEILEERYGRRSTMITSQLPLDKWHEIIGDPTYADAILDRLVHNAHRIELAGESMRRTRGKQNQKA
jgi:IstB-like ATP binding protein